MHQTSLRFACVALTVALLSGCGPREQARETVAAAAPNEVLPPFDQELASLKAVVTLPGAWRGNYRLFERPDTTFGSFRAVEFHYTADSARGVSPALLMVIRAFKQSAWDKALAAKPGFARKLTEHAGDVYAFSVIGQSPYPVSSPATRRVDEMMLALMAETSPLKLTFK